MAEASDHFKQRLKQRANIPKKSAMKFIHKVLKYGIRATDQDVNKALRHYMVSVVDNRWHYSIAYSRYLIVFFNDNNTAVTIFKLPEQHYQEVKNIMEKRGTYNEKGKCHRH